METKLIIRNVGVLHLLIGVITFTLINVLPSASVMAPTFPNPILDDPSGQVVANIQPAVHGVAGLNIGLGLLFLIASNMPDRSSKRLLLLGHSVLICCGIATLSINGLLGLTLPPPPLWIILIAAGAFSFFRYKKGE